MPKIRRKSIENDFLLIFFCMQSEGVAQSSILMILRHPHDYWLTSPVFYQKCLDGIRGGIPV